MKTKITAVNIYDLPKPAILYKYRDWAAPFHDSIIKNCQVYLAPPSSFVDELDCKNESRFDLLTETQILSWYYTSSVESVEHRNYTTAQHIEFANEWLLKTPIRQPGFLEAEKIRSEKEFDGLFGVLSLTADPENLAMWNHYGNKQTGFCVGFDSNILFEFVGGGGPVQYVDDLPVIMPMPFDSFEEVRFKQIYHKLKKWDFEKEYRTHKMSYHPQSRKERTITLRPEAYKEIIFGSKMTEKDKKDIIKVAIKIMPHVIFRQAVSTPDGLNIRIEPYLEPVEVK